ncbi:hypothetical protein [Nostoc sp.]|uniref:hypothetical protein n=1 Tax=Nostoc sp. TaxID=1180 RepID=UPI002FF7BFDE
MKSQAVGSFEQIWIADGSTLEALFRKLKAMYNKSQITEERNEGKLSRSVLKTKVVGDTPVEFNDMLYIYCRSTGNISLFKSNYQQQIYNINYSI